MSEAAAIRYLTSRGWEMIDEGWFNLTGVYDAPVCVETAYHLQQTLERAVA
jgi:hypothetical protein